VLLPTPLRGSEACQRFLDDDWLRLQTANQSLFLQSLSEYVSPSENPPLNQSNPGEVNSQNVAFATNAVFWLAVAGLGERC